MLSEYISIIDFLTFEFVALAVADLSAFNFLACCPFCNDITNPKNHHFNVFDCNYSDGKVHDYYTDLCNHFNFQMVKLGFMEHN
jgi:hypothetical protein